LDKDSASNASHIALRTRDFLKNGDKLAVIRVENV
jgi:hypothetical protein